MMKPMSFLAVGVAAIAGAFLWGAISFYASMEIGWIAWGIGGAVGFAAAVTGSQGIMSGALCAFFALISIFAGKMMAVQWDIQSIDQTEMRAQIEEMYEEDISQQSYQMFVNEAAIFAELARSDYRQFMIDQQYTDADEVDAVDPNEISYFETNSIPRLKYIASENPDYPEWREYEIQRIMEYQQAYLDDHQVDFVLNDLGLFDVIFGFLGVITAFKLGSGGIEGAVDP